MLYDLKLAFRQLAKSRGFTTVAVLTLALGIGANTAIFSLINDLFLRGLPFSRPDEVRRVYGEAPERNLRQLPFSVPRFTHFRENDAVQSVFRDWAADNGSAFTLTGLGEAVRLNGAQVTYNYFSLLGVQPVRGRLFNADEESNASVALVSTSFWRQRLNGDPDIVGRSIMLDRVPHTIVGVLPEMPPVWFGPNSEVFTTRPFEPPGLPREVLQRGVSYLRALGRTRPGVDSDQVLAALRTAQESYRASYPEAADNSWSPVVISATEDATGNLRPAFTTLLVAVGCVLLIACSNVANLLLSRFAGRHREIAVRMALGAPRSRIVRLFLAESVTVSLIAGGFGLLLATWTISMVPALADNLPLPRGVELHREVVLFTLGLALATGLAMGLYPASQSSRADVVVGLRDGGRAIAGSRAQQKIRRGLLALQVALSLVLLVGASLLLVSFRRAQQQPPGFRTDRTWIAGMNLPGAGYPDPDSRQRFVTRLLAELQTLPGVESVAAGQGFPLSGTDSRSPYARADGATVPMNQRPLGFMRSVSPGYLKTFGIPLIAGRDITDRDREDSPLVVLISEATARRHFPNEDPLGRELYFGTNNSTGLRCEIVGIVGDVRSVSLEQANDVEFYRPLSQRNFPFVQVAVRTTGDPAAATAMVNSAVRQIDSNIPLNLPTTMDQTMAASLGQRRLFMLLLGTFASLALVLALVGIYSLVAYSVTQRTGEIGVRLALGATPRDVLSIILRQGMRPVLLGLGVGLACALLLSQLIADQLYQISAHDPVMFVTPAALVLLVSLLACWLPARRATRVDPISALRAE